MVNHPGASGSAFTKTARLRPVVTDFTTSATSDPLISGLQAENLPSRASLESVGTQYSSHTHDSGPES